MDTTVPAQEPATRRQDWREVVAKYQIPDLGRSMWQIANSVIPYLALLYLMARSLEISYWITLALAVPAAGFMMRIFIIFHDCGHGSFFKSGKANAFCGFITGVMTFTPYHYWTRDHAIHHATVSDLDRRGVGDVKTLTVKEYLELPLFKRLVYRFFRNPVIMFLIGPILVFLVVHRFARGTVGKRERFSVYWTNLALLGLLILIHFTFGLKTYVLVQLPILLIGFSIGVWLFYVQHQFEGTYWESHKNWDYVTAALKGSSFYKLPKVLQWFSGNIGFHHIHHLSPRIPNYNLERCHNENPMFQEIEPITLLSSLKSIKFRLWDEERHVLIGWNELKTAQAVGQTLHTLKDSG
jgi:omega-6 fatty acid desaturase (delta-12 desaturase)